MAGSLSCRGDGVRVDGVRVDGYLHSAPTTGRRAVGINLLVPIQALAAVGPRLLSAAGRRGRRGPARSGHTNLAFPKNLNTLGVRQSAWSTARLTPATRRASARTGRFWRRSSIPKSADRTLGSDRPQRRVETASARVRTALVKSTRGEGPPRTGLTGLPRAVPKRGAPKKAARAALRASFWEAARKRGARRSSAAH